MRRNKVRMLPTDAAVPRLAQLSALIVETSPPATRQQPMRFGTAPRAPTGPSEPGVLWTVNSAAGLDKLMLGGDPWDAIGSGAVFSRCGRYRYLLWYRWDTKKPIAGVSGVNPSKADGKKHDTTSRKLVGFGERLGWGGYLLVNPFAFISTDQRGLLSAADPIGCENGRWFDVMLRASALVLCAWGPAKNPRVRRLLNARLQDMRGVLEQQPLFCLGRTLDGSPRHPLMLAYDTPLEPWRLP